MGRPARAEQTDKQRPGELLCRPQVGTQAREQKCRELRACSGAQECGVLLSSVSDLDQERISASLGQGRARATAWGLATSKPVSADPGRKEKLDGGSASVRALLQ